MRNEWERFLDELRAEHDDWPEKWWRDHLTTQRPKLEDFGITRSRLNRYKELPDGSPSPLIFPLRDRGEIAGLVFYGVVGSYGLEKNFPNAFPWIATTVSLSWALFWLYPLRADLRAIRAYRQAESRHNAELARLRSQFEEEQRMHREEKEEREKELRTTLAWWGALDGRGFEVALANLLRERGYTVRLTPHSNDGGIDLILEQSSAPPILVQCKAHTSMVTLGLIRDFYGAVVHYGDHSDSWVVCKSGYTRGAMNFAEGKRLRLLTIKGLLDSTDCLK